IESCARFFFCFCIDVCCSTVTASIRRNIRSFCIHIKSIILHDDCWTDWWFTHFWFLVRSTGKNMVYLVIANWHHYPVSPYPVMGLFCLAYDSSSGSRDCTGGFSSCMPFLFECKFRFPLCLSGYG